MDDYNEMVTVESLLRRLGFDVLSVGKDILVNDALIRFQADLMIASAKGRTVDGLKLVQRLRKAYPSLRMILSFSSGSPAIIPPEAHGAVDAVLELPFQPQTAISLIAKVLSLDPAPLVSKYEKLLAGRTQFAGDAVFVTGQINEQKETSSVTGLARSSVGNDWDPQTAPGKASVTRTARSDRYDKFLTSAADEVDATIPRDKLLQASRDLAAASESDKDKLADIDKEKRKFVTALFEDPDSENKKS